MLLTEVRYLTIDEAAQILRIHPDTIRRLLREKRLPGKKIGREWRIDQESLHAFMRQEESNNEEEETH